MEEIASGAVVVCEVDGVIEHINDPAAYKDAELLLNFAFGDRLESDSEPDNEEYQPTTTNATNNEILIEQGKHARANEMKRISKESYGRQVNKLKRARGEEYESYSKVAGKRVKRAAKTCGVQCQGKLCLEKRRACVTISEEEREECFQKFWKLSNSEKQVYIKALVDTAPPKTKTGDPILSKTRSSQNLHHIKINGKRVQVCKEFFLNVHGIGDQQMRSWLSKDLPVNTFEAQTLNQKIKAKPRPTSETYTSSYEFYSSKLDELPVVESHFSRENCKKRFLEKECQSVLHLHRMITKEAKEVGIQKLSRAKFHELFKKKNLAIHRLKKDLCDSCCKYELLVKAGTVTEEEKVQHEQHRADVMAMRNEKARDKALSTDTNLVMVVDVEKVMPLPKLNNSQQYYLHKLQLKNYTTYELPTSSVTCYLIVEIEGGSDAHEFATLLRDIIKKKKEANPNIQSVIVYSDCCACQNRNAVLSNALLDLAIELNITIVQKYLITGHSKNEGDVCHSCIEKAIRERELYSLEDYVSAIKGARRDEASGGRPGATAFQVEVVTHTKFESYENCKHYSCIRPGQGPGAPTVNQLRALKYTPDGYIFYKLNIADDWTPMPHRLSEPSREITAKYTEKIKIAAAKFRDLQKLKSFVPAECRQYYDELPHL